MHRNHIDKEFNRERLIYQYVRALDRGDADGIAAVLQAALDDPELDRVIEEIHLSYQEELQLTPVVTDAEIVRELVRKCLPSSFEEDLEDTPLTVGEVAARLKADRGVLPADQEANRFLLCSTETLPALLSIQEVKKLAERLGVQASDRYWRNFRDTAITMGMGRGQSHAQLAVAREERARREAVGNRQNKSSQPPRRKGPRKQGK